MESELLSTIPNNRFKDLIVSEIITGSIIQLHELDSSTKSDEDTAKGLVSMNIHSFYSNKHLPKVEDKYWNWENRVQYGWKGRILATPDNLIRFRDSVDLTKPIVQEERSAMTSAVRNCIFKHTSPTRLKFKKPTTTILIGLVLILLTSLGLYSYAITHRYQRINADIIFDNWTGQSIDVFENLDRNEQ